jgi:hypothetical protein
MRNRANALLSLLPLRLPLILPLILLLVLPFALAGCTVYPTPRHPNLATTTSAEQTQRIFWRKVEKADWTGVQALLAPNIVWRSEDRILPRAAIIPWLQSLRLRSASVTGVSLQPNGNDITLVYSLQLSAQRAPIPSPTQPQAQPDPPAQAACLQNLRAVAVWQQPQPSPAPKTRSGPYLLTVEDLALDPTQPGSHPCR